MRYAIEVVLPSLYRTWASFGQIQLEITHMLTEQVLHKPNKEQGTTGVISDHPGPLAPALSTHNNCSNKVPPKPVSFPGVTWEWDYS